MPNTYIVYNGPMTTSWVIPVTTGTGFKTLLQLKPAVPIEVVEWGVSFDLATDATHGIAQLVDAGTVFATVTAYAAADVMPYNDPNAPANSAGTSGTPLNLGTTHSGYTASAEGAISAVRILDPQQISPTGQYVKQFPLGERPKIVAGNSLRVQVKFGAAANGIAYVVFSV